MAENNNDSLIALMRRPDGTWNFDDFDLTNSDSPNGKTFIYSLNDLDLNPIDKLYKFFTKLKADYNKELPVTDAYYGIHSNYNRYYIFNPTGSDIILNAPLVIGDEGTGKQFNLDFELHTNYNNRLSIESPGYYPWKIVSYLDLNTSIYEVQDVDTKQIDIHIPIKPENLSLYNVGDSLLLTAIRDYDIYHLMEQYVVVTFIDTEKNELVCEKQTLNRILTQGRLEPLNEKTNLNLSIGDKYEFEYNFKNASGGATSYYTEIFRADNSTVILHQDYPNMQENIKGNRIQVSDASKLDGYSHVILRDLFLEDEINITDLGDPKAEVGMDYRVNYCMYKILKVDKTNNYIYVDTPIYKRFNHLTDEYGNAYRYSIAYGINPISNIDVTVKKIIQNNQNDEYPWEQVLFQGVTYGKLHDTYVDSSNSTAHSVRFNCCHRSKFDNVNVYYCANTTGGRGYGIAVYHSNMIEVCNCEANYKRHGILSAGSQIVKIYNNYVINSYSSGIDVHGMGSYEIDISNNVCVGGEVPFELGSKDKTGIKFANEKHLTEDRFISITNNTVNGFSFYDEDGTPYGVGIGGCIVANDVFISNNNIIDCTTGIRVMPRSVVTRNITINSNMWHIVNNFVTGCKFGISMIAQTEYDHYLHNTFISGNVIARCANVPKFYNLDNVYINANVVADGINSIKIDGYDISNCTKLYMGNTSLTQSITNGPNVLISNSKSLDIIDYYNNNRKFLTFSKQNTNDILVQNESNGLFKLGSNGNELITLNNSNILLNIPTTDPGISGALWDDNGVLKISQ